MQAPQIQINSLVATTSGICGGVGKAISANLILANITFTGIIDVAFYAAISAMVGYGVKKAIDRVIIFIRKQK
ncbi:MAG: hypothetical protein JW870_04070 [Candidatus Delongbacteria bacterium]|nr:hypothetical protein [Candidatus Delongbacteria bacterium]